MYKSQTFTRFYNTCFLRSWKASIPPALNYASKVSKCFRRCAHRFSARKTKSSAMNNENSSELLSKIFSLTCRIYKLYLQFLKSSLLFQKNSYKLVLCLSLKRRKTYRTSRALAIFFVGHCAQCPQLRYHTDYDAQIEKLSAWFVQTFTGQWTLNSKIAIRRFHLI